MKRFLVGVMWVLAVSGWSDDEAAKIENGRAIIAQMEAVVEQKQAKISRMTDELLAMDAAVEKKIDGLIKTMSSLKDSEDSGNRIERSKRELIEGLEKSIRFYNQRRAAKTDDLTRSHTAMSKDDIKGDVARLDSRVDKRVDQIMQMTQSFTQHEDYDKYLYENRDHYRNVYDGGSVYKTTNPKYQHNKKVARVGENTRSQLIEKVQAAIAGLERDVVLMQSRLQAAQTQEAYDLHSSEIEVAETRIEELTAKIVELAAPPTPTPTRKVGGKKAAHTLDMQVRDTVKGIQQDYRNMLAKKSQLDLERSSLHTVDVKLAYNQKLLSNLTRGNDK